MEYVEYNGEVQEEAGGRCAFRILVEYDARVSSFVAYLSSVFTGEMSIKEIEERTATA